MSKQFTLEELDALGSQSPPQQSGYFSLDELTSLKPARSPVPASVGMGDVKASEPRTPPQPKTASFVNPNLGPAQLVRPWHEPTPEDLERVQPPEPAGAVHFSKDPRLDHAIRPDNAMDHGFEPALLDDLSDAINFLGQKAGLTEGKKPRQVLATALKVGGVPVPSAGTRRAISDMVRGLTTYANVGIMGGIAAANLTPAGPAVDIAAAGYFGKEMFGGAYDAQAEQDGADRERTELRRQIRVAQVAGNKKLESELRQREAEAEQKYDYSNGIKWLSTAMGVLAVKGGKGVIERSAKPSASPEVAKPQPAEPPADTRSEVPARQRQWWEEREWPEGREPRASEIPEWKAPEETSERPVEPRPEEPAPRPTPETPEARPEPVVEERPAIQEAPAEPAEPAVMDLAEIERLPAAPDPTASTPELIRSTEGAAGELHTHGTHRLSELPTVKRIIAGISEEASRKRNVNVEPFNPMDINSYWSDGSRSEYAIVNLSTGQVFKTPVSHPYYDIVGKGGGSSEAYGGAITTDHAGNVTLHRLPPDTVLVQTGHFQGETRVPTIYVPDNARPALPAAAPEAVLIKAGSERSLPPAAEQVAAPASEPPKPELHHGSLGAEYDPAGLKSVTDKLEDHFASKNAKKATTPQLYSYIGDLTAAAKKYLPSMVLNIQKAMEALEIGDKDSFHLYAEGARQQLEHELRRRNGEVDTQATPEEAISKGRPFDPENPKTPEELSREAAHKKAALDWVAEENGKRKKTAQTYYAETAQPFRLPRELSGAKPRYGYAANQYTLDFKSDLDKAAYIVAQAKKSMANDAYLQALADAGITEPDAIARGNAVKARIKEMAKTAENGSTLVVEAGESVSQSVVSKRERTVLKETLTSGQTLTEFLREHGGIKDTGGELEGMNVDHGRKPFEKKLINNEKGMDPDRAREMAAEAGFMGNGSIDDLMSMTTPTDLFELIREDVSGKSVRSIHYEPTESPLAELGKSPAQIEAAIRKGSGELYDQIIDVMEHGGAEAAERQRRAAEGLDLEREAMRATEEGDVSFEFGEETMGILDTKIEESNARIKEMFTSAAKGETLGTNLPAEVFAELVRNAALRVGRGGVRFAQWARETAQAIGDRVTSEDLQEAWEEGTRRAAVAREINPDEYFNFRRVNISDGEKAALRAQLIDTIIETGRHPKEVEPHAEIVARARALDIDPSQYLPPAKNMQPQLRAVVHAARQRINTLNLEIFQERRSLSGLTGNELVEAEGRLDVKERDLSQITGIYMPITSEFGRNLAMLRMQADATWDASYWLARAHRAADLPAGTTLPHEIARRVGEILNDGDTPANRSRMAREIAKLQQNGILDGLIGWSNGGLLTGLRTHMVNTGSNVAHAAYLEASRILSSTVDIALATGRLAVGKEYRRTVQGPSPKAVFRSILEAMNTGSKEALSTMKFDELSTAGGLTGRIATFAMDGRDKIVNKVVPDRERMISRILELERQKQRSLLDARTLSKSGMSRELNTRAPKTGIAAIDKPIKTGIALLDKGANTIFRSLAAEDAFARSYAFRRSMEARAWIEAKNSGRTALEVMASPTESMIAEAIFDAEIDTFNNPNALAKMWNAGLEWANRVEETDKNYIPAKAARFNLKLIARFTNTPANVISRMFQYHPLTGTAPRASYAVYKSLINKAMRPEDQKMFSEAVGKGLTGSAILYLGAKLYDKGLATGAPEEDKAARATAEAEGRQPGSILIDGQWRQIANYGPVGTMITIGATLRREGTRPLRNEALRPDKIGAVVGRTALDMPMLKGLNDVIDALRHPDTTGNKVSGAMAGAFVPTFFADASALWDPYKRDARASSWTKAAVKGAQARLPVLRNMLPERRDVLGQPVPEEQNVFDPLRSSPAKDTPLSASKVNIGAVQRQSGESDEGLRLRSIYVGKQVDRQVKRAIAREGFAGLTEAKKQQRLKDAVDNGRDIASNRVKALRSKAGKDEAEYLKLLQQSIDAN